MSVEMDKTQLIEEIKSEREYFETTLAKFSRDQMTSPLLDDGWSLKDLLAHITVWEQRMLKWVGSTLRDEVPEMLPQGLTWSDEDINRWNQQTYLDLKDKPLGEVLADFESSYPQALAIAERSTEEQLFDKDHYAWRGGRPLYIMVAADTSWHYKEHNTQLQGLLEDEDSHR